MSAAEVDPARLERKLTLRLILPFLLLIVLNSLDRVNVGFAASRMNPALGLTPESYGFGVGLFFAGYMAGQIPSMWLLQRFGMRRWMAGVIFSWGVVATAMAFVQDAAGFYALRLLLGLAEAGFAPGVTYCCAQWMPKRMRGGAISKTMVAIPISVIFGAPLSGWLMDTVALWGFPGWRWMIFLEGLPALLAGIAAWWLFVDRPADARWLTVAERRWLAEAVDRDRPPATAAAAAPGAVAWRGLLGTGFFWVCAATWFGLLTGAYGLIYWLPLVVKQVASQGHFATGVLTALPWVGVAAGMLINARHSDRTQERFLHVALPALLAAAGLVAAAAVGAGWQALALLMVAGYGLGAAQGTFWTLPTGRFDGAVLPLGIALVNMTGNLGGLLGPPMIGWLRTQTGSFAVPVYAMAAIIAAAAFGLLAVRRR